MPESSIPYYPHFIFIFQEINFMLQKLRRAKALIRFKNTIPTVNMPEVFSIFLMLILL